MVIQQKISTQKLVTVGACMHKTYSYLCKLFLIVILRPFRRKPKSEPIHGFQETLTQ